jgi:hypothetical protein
MPISPVKTAVSKMMCYIVRLDCRNKEQKEIANHLQGAAEAQVDHFNTIHPWRHGCTENIFMYVAITRPHGLRAREELTLEHIMRDRPNICGWMTVHATREKAEVVFLASRKSTDNSYAGIGTALLDTLYKDCMEGTLYGQTVDFIYLFALPSAKSFYMQVFRDKRTGLAKEQNIFGQPKSFFEMKPESLYLYLPVRSPPTARFVRNSTRPRPSQVSRTDYDHVHEIMEELDEEYASKLETLLRQSEREQTVLYISAAYEMDGVDGVEEMIDSLIQQ